MSHTRECMSYARHVAEQDAIDQRGYVPPPDEVDRVAVESLSSGDVSCVCAEVPR